MLEKELGTHNYQTIHENLLEVSKSKLSVTCVLSFCHIKAILFLLMFSLTFSACKMMMAFMMSIMLRKYLFIDMQY